MASWCPAPAAGRSPWPQPGAIRLWDRTTLKVLRSVDNSGTRHVHSAFRPHGRPLAAHNAGAPIQIRELATGAPGVQRPVPEYAGSFAYHGFSRDGTRYATSRLTPGGEREVLLWPLRSARPPAPTDPSKPAGRR